jgi:hypothetical protein
MQDLDDLAGAHIANKLLGCFDRRTLWFAGFAGQMADASAFTDSPPSTARTVETTVAQESLLPQPQ